MTALINTPYAYAFLTQGALNLYTGLTSRGSSGATLEKRVHNFIAQSVDLFTTGYLAPTPIGASAFVLAGHAVGWVQKKFRRQLDAAFIEWRVGAPPPFQKLTRLVGVALIANAASSHYAAASPLWQKVAILAGGKFFCDLCQNLSPDSSIREGAFSSRALFVLDMTSRIALTLLLKNPIWVAALAPSITWAASDLASRFSSNS